MCVFSMYLFCSVIENMFAVNCCTMLKYTFGISSIIGFRGTPFWPGVWLRTVISLVIVGDMRY
jgi:hypothetical protein